MAMWCESHRINPLGRLGCRDHNAWYKRAVKNKRVMLRASSIECHLSKEQESALAKRRSICVVII